MSDNNNENNNNESISCPFCNDFGFDLIGLKEHLLRYYCEVFNEIERLK